MPTRRDRRLSYAPRPEHAPQGDPCRKCGQERKRHRARVRDREAYHKRREEERPPRRVTDLIIGVDGEGVGRKPHRYIYLAAKGEDGRVWQAENAERLSAQECLDLLLELPRESLCISFAFHYDLTKILADLPDLAIWMLFHEESRQKITEDGRVVYRAIRWKGYRLNYMNRRFSVGRGKRSRTVWDVFGFFQGKFTKALEDWKTCKPADLAIIAGMKDRRSKFRIEDLPEVEAYCQLECGELADLTRALVDAHEDAGLVLKHYYGAGSTASAFLTRCNVRESLGEIPGAMRHAVACAFVGGRFENRVSGPVPGPIHNKDINSAYPYQCVFLPCLVHGYWEHHAHSRGKPDALEKVIDGARLALCHWASDLDLGNDHPWGAFPVRASNGSIMFPRGGRGGWTWKDEWRAGRSFGDFRVTEAWVYRTDCDCQPFREIPSVYLERLRLGSDGRGIVLKLGTNSIYGKTAQSRGLNPPFQSWVWAGNITSGTRAQLLDAISAAGDPADVLMLATDGVWSRRPIRTPAPRETGTDLEVNGKRKPLGGWAEKTVPGGIFAVRPGIYFPLDPTEADLSDVRARGLGKRALYERNKEVTSAWASGRDHNGCLPDCESTGLHVRLGGLQRFVGAKSGIRRLADGTCVRSADYGEWVDHAVQVSFDCRPKRRSVHPGTENRLGGRGLEPWQYLDWESSPYDPAIKSPEADAIADAEEFAEEQPDLEFERA